MCEEKETIQDFDAYVAVLKKMAAEEGCDSLDETFVEHLRCRYFGQDVMIGETARVVLREMRMSDLEAFYGFEDAVTEPVLQSFIKESWEESKVHLQAYIAQMYPFYDYGMWTVVEKEKGKIIGICGLGQSDLKETECPDLGYYICPKWRNQGIASECIEIVLDYAENYLGIPAVCAVIKEENRISERILCKFGFGLLGRIERVGERLLIYQKK